MDPLLIVFFESGFNLLYLALIWALVVLMTRNLPAVSAENRATAGFIRIAFILLAAGDSGHVGFRVLGYLLGGLETPVELLGASMTLAGLGTLSTSITVTLFYMVLVIVWQKRFHQPSSGFTGFLLAAGLVRLALMALPGNDWAAVTPPHPMSIYRNIPLLIQGAGVMGLFLFSGYREKDRTFQTIGWMIFLSFAFYVPVILFVQQAPLLGMLMIPKTCAYLVMAWVAYRSVWR
ncbi:MAG: hypothetical protein JXN59_02505 [Anaerolineae bacterium]|nr:hypothetical protein [Anaerolineae bacterium]